MESKGFTFIAVIYVVIRKVVGGAGQVRLLAKEKCTVCIDVSTRNFAAVGGCHNPHLFSLRFREPRLRGGERYMWKKR